MADQPSPHVSVITPVYKTPLNYFKECLNSLYNQTMLDAEFIIVFDGANEDLKSICEIYKKKDCRFKIFIQPHLGVSATRNFGIKQAKGEYITFVDADDSIEKNCCLETYNFAKKNNSEIVLFDYTPIDNQYKAEHLYSESASTLSIEEIENLQKQAIYLTDERYVAAVSTWCKLIKKNFIDNNNISFSTNLKICVDRPVSFSIFLFSTRISYLNKTFYNYNKVDTSITWIKYKEKAPLSIAYLVEIKKISTKFSGLLGQQAMEIFLSSWSSNYFIKERKNNIRESVIKIQKLAKSSDFQWLIKEMDSSKWSHFIKLEAFLIKHKILFHIWLHAIKWKYLSHH
ncbi:glycosyltransferase family 2 protein [uncultured Fibrobacter sp.]|uniref:glycosyltransferase family 2 protein n=1 Tax=uncultured Fibrobacter sp. TaxID=261512 RepID=UPI0025D79C6E|nr:glycosyltransferase family 2 protein [uncultured Fibrobacter sp.]